MTVGSTLYALVIGAKPRAVAVAAALHALIIGAHIIAEAITIRGTFHALIAGAHTVGAVATGDAFYALGPGAYETSRTIGVVRRTGPSGATFTSGALIVVVHTGIAP